MAQSFSSAAMEVRPYYKPNWFSEAGVRAKQREIEAKGVPNMTNWRFLTLTVDPLKGDNDPLTCYLLGKERLRRFMLKLRDYFGCDLAGCWKLEFFESGFAHWHMPVSWTRKLTLQQMGKLSVMWGLGRVNVKRIEGATLDYLFKYVYKSPVKSGQAVPEWFLDYYVPAGEDRKPESFSRVRFFQTFGNFYTGEKSPTPPKKEKRSCFLVVPLREAVAVYERSMQFVSRCAGGGYRGSVVCEVTVEGGAVGAGNLLALLTWGRVVVSPRPNQYICDQKTVRDITLWQNKPRLQTLLRLDRLRPEVALTAMGQPF